MEDVLNETLELYRKRDEVRAIAIGGSGVSSGRKNYADKLSDIDVYVFVEKDIPLEIRQNFKENIEELLVQPNSNTLQILDNMIKEIRGII